MKRLTISEIASAIQWHEGMLLAPQHFQQWSLRQEQLLHYAMQILTSFAWGVQILKIDPVLLLNGRLTISELEAIMPDGLFVTGSATENELSLNLTPYLKDVKYQPIMVYLSVPRYDVQALDTARYQSVEGKPVTDVNTGEASLSIPRLKPKLALAVGEPPESRFIYFPLAQVAYKNEALALTDFIPPTLSVSPRSPLGSMITSVLTRAREKAAFLSDRLDSSSPAVYMDKPMLLETQLRLQGIVPMLPQLEAQLYANVCHPFSVYLGLCAMAGQAAACTDIRMPPVFPAYNHNDLYTTFSIVCRFIHDCLDTIQESYTIISFQSQEQHFVLKMQPEWLTRYLLVGARIASKSSEMELTQWIKECLIGSENHIAFMVEKRILGPQRARLEKAEDLNLVPPRGIVLFRVEIEKKFIEPEQVLHIVNPQVSIHRPAEMVLFVKTET
ncbi:MAG: hypothetical protein BWK79_00295 [Beggiatoa sp. IS2]|nr:MAG: hypothetical protein BWK79_00295 [Beggiatoa sp. IS2]